MTAATRRTVWETRLWVAGLLFLVMLRLPSVVAPVGSDQSLYMYVADRILAGGAPYVDAWDQKPPGVHFAYAVVRAVWPHSSAVPLLDFIATVATAALLVGLGRRLSGLRTGFTAAAVFLLFGDPAIARLDGLYLRGQCEVLIGLAVVIGVWLVWDRPPSTGRLFLAGICLGIAVWTKYNAITYVAVILAAAYESKSRQRIGLVRTLVPVAAGGILVSVVVLAFLAAHGAIGDWWLATITYNLSYSGETYSGGWFGAARYAVMMPLHRLRMDFLWFLGGLGAVLMVTASALPARTRLVVAVWIVAALGSILLNGARDLPQYFLQAKPALALAFAFGLASLLDRSFLVAAATAGAILIGLWRVGTDAPGPLGFRWGGLPQLAENVGFDLAYATGRVERRAYLARFKGQQKYDAVESEDLTTLIRTTTAPGETIFVLGYSTGVYLEAGRLSASRFFWSRPVVIEFAADQPGYGSRGLLTDLERARPSVVALQKQDWGPREPVSHDFMLNTPHLRAWLDANYVQERDTPFYSIWRRRTS
jgi:hypothetical protein